MDDLQGHVIAVYVRMVAKETTTQAPAEPCNHQISWPTFRAVP